MSLVWATDCGANAGMSESVNEPEMDTPDTPPADTTDIPTPDNGEIQEPGADNGLIS